MSMWVNDVPTEIFTFIDRFRLMNIMYYDQKANADVKTTGGIAMGPFYITPEQVCILLH